jgi:hypothetical protein
MASRPTTRVGGVVPLVEYPKQTVDKKHNCNPDIMVSTEFEAKIGQFAHIVKAR